MSSFRADWKFAAWLGGAFLAFYLLPLESLRFQNALAEGLALARWYAREHVILCLVPAFFIAGAIATFVRQDAVMRYLGPNSPRLSAYGVASVSGSILSVCSCTVLPLFAGIWRMGAGLGPAVAFLYSGPAISALAIILTARILGFELGVARALGAVVFAIVIGALMAWIFRKEEAGKARAAAGMADAGPPPRPLWKTASWLWLMVALLIFANWSDAEKGAGIFGSIAEWKWTLTSAAALGIALVMGIWFGAPWWKIGTGAGVTIAAAFAAPGHVPLPFAAGSAALAWIAATTEGELRDWFDSTWEFTKLIAPMLIAGVFAAGFLLGRPGHEGLIPREWVDTAVGGNSLRAVLLASVAGAFMYFATLTEIPILQGLIGGGMGKGPALALLLSGPALSLPSMLALWKIIGGKKTLCFTALVIVMSSVAGWCYGRLF